MLGLIAPPPPTMDPQEYYFQVALSIFFPHGWALMQRGASAIEAKVALRGEMINEGFPPVFADSASAALSNWLTAAPDLARVEPLFPSWMSDVEKHTVRALVVAIGGSRGMYGPAAMDEIIADVNLLTTADYVRRGGGTMPALRAIGNQSAEYTFGPLLKKSAQRVYAASAPLRAVLDAVPWPHPWFKDFALATDPVNFPVGGPFAGAALWDFYALMQAGYFARAPAAIEDDVARWIADNANTLATYFQRRVEQWVVQQEGKAKSGVVPAAMSLVRGVLFIGGMAASIFVPLAGQLALTAVQSGFKFAEAVVARDNARDFIQSASQTLGIAPRAWSDFAAWVAARVVRTTLSVSVNGEGVGTATSVSGAAELAAAHAAPGDKVEIAGAGGVTVYRTDTGAASIPPISSGWLAAAGPVLSLLKRRKK